MTHDVLNQVPPLVGFDSMDYPAFHEALVRSGAAAAEESLHEIGQAAGSAEAFALGDRAESHPPVLHTHDRFGHRVDRVAYDPSYHELMTTATRFGLHGAPWQSDDPHAHLVRAIGYSLWTAVDAGHGCPITMTYAAVPALREDATLADRYAEKLGARGYDPSFRAPEEKQFLTAGMSMTEKQGGSDVRANTTSATQQPDGTYLLDGHKWFTSAPMCDIFLTLANTPAGVTCFVLPRILPDGTVNGIRLQRLKEKLGNHSNASSEVEYVNAVGWRLGDEGRGVATIIRMVNATRMDCALGSATTMRVGVQNAVHHANHRHAFGKALIDQPLMRNVLADLAIEAEAATTTVLWLAALTDRTDAESELLRRIGIAVTKYYVCKRAPIHAAEALECLGGNGYIEDSRMPRLYREAPLMSIWEGSGNVTALDTLRAAAKQPDTISVLMDELGAVRGNDPRYDHFLDKLGSAFDEVETLELRARRVVGDLALAVQASQLLRHGHPAVAEAFLASRLDGQHGDVFGTLPAGLDLAPILERATLKGSDAAEHFIA